MMDYKYYEQFGTDLLKNPTYLYYSCKYLGEHEGGEHGFRLRVRADNIGYPDLVVGDVVAPVHLLEERLTGRARDLIECVNNKIEESKD